MLRSATEEGSFVCVALCPLFLKIISLHTSNITLLGQVGTVREGMFIYFCVFVLLLFFLVDVSRCDTKMTNQIGSMIARKHFNLVLCLSGCNHHQIAVLTSLKLINMQTSLIHPVTIPAIIIFGE